MSDQTKKLPESDSPAAPITAGGALAVPVVWEDPEDPAVLGDPEAPAVLGDPEVLAVLGDPAVPAVLGDPEVPAVLGAYVVLDAMAAKAAKWATCWAGTMEER
ncbi:MAG: hypothetical protein AAGU02_09560 [Lawsonibacter sp.]